MVDFLTQPVGNPRTISGRIQEWLGAKQPAGNDQVAQVLSMRQEPTINDIGGALRQTLRGGKEVSGQDFADSRLNDAITRLSTLQKYRNDVGGQNLPAALQLANEYQKRIATGDVDGANLIAQFAKTTDKGIQVDANGNYIPMNGYGPALGNIKYGQKSGEQQAVQDYSRGIELEKGRGSNAAEIESVIGGKTRAADQTLDLTAKARGYLKTATSGPMENILTGANKLAGRSTDATKADTQLKIIGGALTSNVPRMEGPQSNYDVQLYREMAGNVANPNLSVEDRLAALDTLEQLQTKYATGGNPLTINKQASSPPENIQPGMTVDGYIFQGGDPSDPNSWVPQ